GLRPPQAVGVDRLDEALDVELAGRADEPHLDLPRPAPLADHQVAQVAALGEPIPGAVAALDAERQRLRSHAVDALGDELAVRHVHDVVPAAGRVEAAHELAFGAGAERELDLVAVA